MIGGRGRHLLATGAGLSVALGALAGCHQGSTDDAFCDQVALVRSAGPLFPARTDGEPVPDRAALTAIEGLADHRPGDIAEEIGIIVDESRALVAEADHRLGRTAQVQPPSSRWSRSAVETAQRAVIDYAARTCRIDLTRTAG